MFLYRKENSVTGSNHYEGIRQQRLWNNFFTNDYRGGVEA